MKIKNKETGNVINIAQYKLNISIDLYKESLYIEALRLAYEGLKILQANGLAEDKCAADLVNLIGYICFDMANSSQDPLGIMLENLVIMKSNFPDIEASNDNIISLLFNIAVEYTKLGSSGLDALVQYASESMRLLKKTNSDSDHKYYQNILGLINSICEHINAKYTQELFNKEDFKNMYVLAGVVYDLAKEFLVSPENTVKYTINLGISCNKLGLHLDSLRYLREAQNEARNLSESENDLINHYIQESLEIESYRSTISDAKSLYDLSKSQLTKGHYEKAIDNVVNGANLFLNVDVELQGTQIEADLLVLMREISSYTTEKIWQHYKNNELNEGIEVANIAKESFSQFGDDAYALSFFALAAEGYYKSENCAEAINYFPEIIQGINSSDIEGFDVVQKWIKDCDGLKKKEIALAEFSKACELIGDLTLVECYSYLAGLIDSDN